jgi:hypothetical protein
MGFAPPENFPAPGTGALTPGAKFATPEEAVTLPCGISFVIPSTVLGILVTIPLPFPIKLPSVNIHFKLSCNLDDPIDISANLAWGAGATSNAPPNPNDNENEPTFSVVGTASSNSD